MGLEALEKPLADAMKIPPGVEEVQGQCEKCGAQYTQRKTVLVGVRAYVQGDLHPETASSERKREWKEINDLRHRLFHSLEDSAKLEQDVHSVLPATMHYLHDAVCCLSHAHSLESPGFKLDRGTRRPVLVGRFRASGLGPLENFRLLHDVEGGRWVDHPQHGSIPEFRICASRLKDLKVAPFWLGAPLGSASEGSLVATNLEID